MRNAEKVSHTGYWRAQFEADQAAVLYFTEMSLDELTNLKLDMGEQWLAKHLHKAGIKEADAKEMWKEAKVLQWWNLNWRQYDHYHILPFLHKVTEGERRAVYEDMHLNVFDLKHPEYRRLHEKLLGVMKLLTGISAL